MLSILIPVYNFDVRGLVSDLLVQIDAIDQAIEVILLDDSSEEEWRSVYGDFDNRVSIHYSSSNQGRVATRKKLVGLAKYDYLLFVDCDAQIVSTDYLNKYLKIIDESQVVCGGHTYQTDRPSDEYVLHWKYGKEVEVRSIRDRLLHPYQSFSSFNFACTRSVFEQYLGEVDVSGYGHEDTLMGHILCSNNIDVHHMENPLCHIGLKDADQFLSDIESAVKNALLIQEKYPEINIKLLKYERRLQQWGVLGLVKWYLKLNMSRILKDLKSSNPSIRNLQLYKLYLISNQ